MNCQDVLRRAAQLTNAHLQQNARRIKDDIYPMRGGWEGWAQVELAVILKDTLQSTAMEPVKVFRENSSLYKLIDPTRNLKADLVFQLPVRGGRGQPDAYFHLVVELKCQRSTGAIPAAEWFGDHGKFELVKGAGNGTSVVGVMCMACFLDESHEPLFGTHRKNYNQLPTRSELSVYARYHGRNTSESTAGAALAG